MKIGVIDVGGGMRASYGAGVFDWCMDNGIHFDYCAGVSAGSANVVSYLAGQRGRNYVFYTEYDMRDECMSFGNYVRTGNFVDLEYAYGELSNEGGEYPLDFRASLENPAEFKIVATSALTGKPQDGHEAGRLRSHKGIQLRPCREQAVLRRRHEVLRRRHRGSHPPGALL